MNGVMHRITRSSGVLMPVFSLPSPHGIGTLGKEAFKFVVDEKARLLNLISIDK